ncbi:hypothetical protein NXW09_06175 [Bacteroides ovatus]|nr:hypothetical protein [Bacteroides ovatus]
MKKLSFLIATALCIMACSGGSDEQPDGPGNGNGNGGGGVPLTLFHSPIL